MTKEEKIAIQKKEMTGCMNYFKNNQLDFNDTKLLQKMQNSITRIFQVEIEELGYSYQPNRDDSQNTFGLEFINDSKETFRGQCHNSDGKSSITYNIARLYSDLQSPDVDKRLLACKTLYKTVFHEIQHHRQYLMARTNVSSKDGLTYARDFALSGYLEKDWYSRDKKTGNYDAYSIENNANEVGYRQYLETMGLSDKEITDLMNIEQGKFNIARYKANVNSWDGQSHYESDGLQERDDVTVPILDDLICVRGRTEILKQYPILQKEYNLDGTKKSAIDLIKNMQKEIQDISQNQGLSNEDKAKLIRNGKEMYYELIYRQIKKSTPEQIAEIVKQIGKDESKELFGKISHYFQCEMEDRLGKSAKMASAQERLGNYGFIMPFNNGTIEIEQNGKRVQLSFEDFIKTIDPKLLQQKFIIPDGKSKGEMSAEQFIEKYFFSHLSQNGQVKLKDGTEISAKQYVEQYALQMGELRKDYTPKKFIMDTMQSESPWAIQKENCERLEQYYEGKKQVLADVEQKVSSYDPTKVDEQQQKKIFAHQRKMQWVKDFIKDYEATEKGTAYALRSNCENENIKRVVNSIKSGKFVEDFDNNATNYKDDPEWFMGKLMPSMARLLKEADNLTIDGGIDYLEKFVSIPEVNKILLQIRDNEQLKQMHNEAEDNRKNGSLPKYHRTRAEIDKQYAQDYLRSGNLSQGSVEQEIDYRRGLTNRSLIKVSNEKQRKDIPLLRRQQISLTRVLARQDGKTPSEAIYDEKRKGWYCITDTQAEQKKVNTMTNPNTYDITPETITRDTKNVGLQDINNVTQATKQLQNQRTNQEQQVSR
ncbi:MAG: hypothetical protein ACI4UX_04705 [Clostridia bacterium]